eukprot:m.179089 g.179089  ORF g.179089 m.179089 type:complete len:220 (-) comp14640_c4_seq7:1506-2165(-)
MSRWSFIVVAITAAVVSCIASAKAETLQYKVEHAIGDGPFVERGVIEAPLKGHSSLKQSISDDFLKQLEAAAATDAFYRVRVLTLVDGELVSDTPALSIAPACAVIASSFVDTLKLHVAEEGTLVAIEVVPSSKQCGQKKFGKNVKPKCTVLPVYATQGPTPETAPIVAKMEAQTQKREAGEPEEDSRSFLERYWMYIVPFLVIQLISAFMQPTAQEKK